MNPEIQKLDNLIAAAKHYRDTLIKGKPLGQMYADASLHRAAYAVFEDDVLHDRALEIEGFIRLEVGGWEE